MAKSSKSKFASDTTVVVFYDTLGDAIPVCASEAEAYMAAMKDAGTYSEYEEATGVHDHGYYDAVFCAVCGARLSTTR